MEKNRAAPNNLKMPAPVEPVETENHLRARIKFLNRRNLKENRMPRGGRIRQAAYSQMQSDR